MLFRIKIDDFSGFRIHPGHGFVFVRADARLFHYFNYKSLNLAMAKKNPRKVAWTQVYRKLHKKDSSSDGEKRKRARKTLKSQRAIVGVSLEAIRAKKVQAPKTAAVSKGASSKDTTKSKKTKAAKSLKLQAVRAQNKPATKNVAPKGGKGGGKGGR